MDEYAAGRTPNPCLRCNEKIKFAAVLDRALALGLRRGRHRPLRAAAHRRRRADRDAPRGRPRQGPVLRARRARPGAARALAVPARRLDQARRARARPRARGLLVADKPDSHDICFVADGDNAGLAAREARRPRAQPRRRRSSTTRPARCSAATRAPTASRSASARGCGSAARRRTASRASCSTSSRSPAPSRVGPREQLAVDRARRGIKPRWCGTVPARAATGTVQLRAHGDEHRAVVDVTGDDGRRSSCSTRRTASRPARPPWSTTARRVVGSATIAATSRDRRHRMTLATGVGSMPGDDAARRSTRPCGSCSTSCPTCRTCPSCPGRGATADMTGRGAGRGRRARRRPAARRLAAHRRVRASTTAGRAACSPRTSTPLEEHTQGYAGAFKIQVAGPWTLAATVEKPRGDKVLADHGARRELAQALAEGCATTSPTYAAGCRGVDRLVVQVDEPALAAVLGGQGADGVRLRPAPHRAPARGLRGAGAGCSPRSPTRAPSRGCTRCAPGTPLGAAARRRARAGSRSTSTCSPPPTTTTWPRRSRPGETVAPRRRARRTDPATAPTDTQRHRAGAALARHARPRPGRGGRPAGGHARLRAGRRVAGLGAPALALLRPRPPTCG